MNMYFVALSSTISWSMEFDVFRNIRDSLCASDRAVMEGKMMSSPAIHYKNKVFAFFSRKNTMVFKLGKNYPVQALDIQICEFNPFKNKGPLRGWYEVDYTEHDSWSTLTSKALELIKSEQKAHDGDKRK